MGGTGCRRRADPAPRSTGVNAIGRGPPIIPRQTEGAIPQTPHEFDEYRWGSAAGLHPGRPRRPNPRPRVVVDHHRRATAVCPAVRCEAARNRAGLALADPDDSDPVNGLVQAYLASRRTGRNLALHRHQPDHERAECDASAVGVSSSWPNCRSGCSSAPPRIGTFNGRSTTFASVGDRRPWCCRMGSAGKPICLIVVQSAEPRSFPCLVWPTRRRTMRSPMKTCSSSCIAFDRREHRKRFPRYAPPTPPAPDRGWLLGTGSSASWYDSPSPIACGAIRTV